MRIRAMFLAVMFAISGVAIASAQNMPPTMKLPSTGSPGQPLDHGKKYQKKKQDYGWNGGVDCHRDVRTHRINGVKIRHRHVGDSCQVREVRQVN
ncbi:MAG: hypothetical protein JNK47_05785 [Mesorhizobium sp.]|nr:hypothetical protein [Mesorhizobium sp.]MBL8576714.1 hypothetical protein [Mesorhizobium sp.]